MKPLDLEGAEIAAAPAKEPVETLDAELVEAKPDWRERARQRALESGLGQAGGKLKVGGEGGIAKWTPETRFRILNYLEAGCDMKLAATLAGISAKTVEGYRRTDPEWKALMDEAREVANERVISTLFEMATVDRNVVACIFWLKNRKPQEWRDRHEIVETEKKPERLDIRLDDGAPIAAIEGVSEKGVN